VIVSVRIPAETEVFRKSLSERTEECRQIAERGRSRGALHHRFAVGDGFVLADDEWESAEAFQSFFGDPGRRAFVGSVGAHPNTPPEVTFGEAIGTPDQF
jgi:hypothetical protein